MPKILHGLSSKDYFDSDATWDRMLVVGSQQGSCVLESHSFAKVLSIFVAVLRTSGSDLFPTEMLLHSSKMLPNCAMVWDINEAISC